MKKIKRLTYEQETCLYEKIQKFLDDVNKYVEENIYEGVDTEKAEKEVNNEKTDTSNKEVNNENTNISNKEENNEKTDTSNEEVNNRNTNTDNKEVIPLTVGKFTFDYTKNNGVFIIGAGDYYFTTKWSQSSNLSINAYKYCWDIVSLARVRCDLNLFFTENEELDFSSIIRTPQIGDTVVWKNINDNFATTKIIDIKDVESGDDVYELTCEYTIYEYSHFFV